jgi:pectin lyase
MYKTNKQRRFCLLLSLILGAVFILSSFEFSDLSATAISTDYPVQTVNFATSDNSKNLNISADSDKSACMTKTADGSQNENWRLDYVNTDSKGSFYKITNMGTGRLLTPLGYNASEGVSCVIFGSESKSSQHWYITAVSQDSYGNDLYYKITNYDNSDLALTYNSSTNTVTLSAYKGTDSQKWLLNTSGVQGFAGYCKDNSGNPKASVTGGLLGKTVEVTTFDELKAACTDDETKTIVITANISKTGTYTTDSNGRYQFKDARIYLRPNKTIIGSYNAHSLYNVYFCTYDREDYGLGENIIIRNIEISHDSELNNDNVWDFKYGENMWIDHCTFIGHSDVNTASTGLVDWDKFICFYDDADFVTISDCKFGLHEYGLLLGQPADTDDTLAEYNGKPYVTLADNYFNNCLTRAPGLMRYGYFHSLNNYVVNFNLGYTVHTACKLYAEACYYDGGTGKGSVVNDDATKITDISSSNIAAATPYYTDVNSKAVNCYRDNNLSNISSNVLTQWKPSNNYSYKAKTADEAKTYCETYSGAQSSKSTMAYAVYSQVGVPSAGFVTAPSVDMTEESTTKATTTTTKATTTTTTTKATTTTTTTKATTTTTTTKSTTTTTTTTKATTTTTTTIPTTTTTTAITTLTTEKVVLKDGAVIDTTKSFQLQNENSKLYMEVKDANASNSANVQQWGANSAQSHNLWKAVDAGNGYYYIVSQLADGSTYYLDIDYGKTENGTNIAIYTNTKSDAQLFKFVKVSDNTYTIVTKVSNDKSCVEVKDASLESGANVQEWECNSNSCQNWILTYYDENSEPETTVTKGDINSDGKINVVDLTLAKYYYSDTSKITDSALEKALDYNSDGNFDINDIKLLNSYLIKRAN